MPTYGVDDVVKYFQDLFGGANSKKENGDEEKGQASESDHKQPFQPTPSAPISRVPNNIRQGNPDAYTPQLVLIGPFQHFKAKAAKEGRKSKYKRYKKMEDRKDLNITRFEEKFNKETVDKMKEIIKEKEDEIRHKYAESTEKIESQEFIDMIYRDSIFVYMFIDSLSQSEHDLWDNPNERTTVCQDLTLLENQLPYFILEELFGPLVSQEDDDDQTITSFRKLLLTNFPQDFIRLDEGEINREGIKEFEHITDMLRCARVAGINEDYKNKNSGGKSFDSPNVRDLYSADKLRDAGVKFVWDSTAEPVVNFKGGNLYLPRFTTDYQEELILRNITALEQLRYPDDTYVCSFVKLFRFLIQTEKDVELLNDRGILKIGTREPRAVVKMMKKLGDGLVENQSLYYHISRELNKYHKNPINRARGILKRTYFDNFWRGTATVVATVIFSMTLVQTWASVIQAQNALESPPPSNHG